MAFPRSAAAAKAQGSAVFYNPSTKKFQSAGASTAIAKSRHHVAHATKKGGKSKARGFLAGLGGGKGAGLMSSLKTATPLILVAGLAFGLTRWGVRAALGRRADGTLRDAGWMGFAANAGAMIVGFLVVRKFAPRFAMAFLIGAGLAIVMRAFARFAPEQAQSVGLETSEAEAFPSDAVAGAGVNGVYPRGGMHGVQLRDVA